jgi:hypothetical protein
MTQEAHGTRPEGSIAVPFAAATVVASVLLAIAAVVHFVFADAAIAGVIGFGVLFVVAISVKLFQKG